MVVEQLPFSRIESMAPSALLSVGHQQYLCLPPGIWSGQSSEESSLGSRTSWQQNDFENENM